MVDAFTPNDAPANAINPNAAGKCLKTGHRRFGSLSGDGFFMHRNPHRQFPYHQARHRFSKGTVEQTPKTWELSRLSVSPVTQAQFNRLLALAETE
jgi:hypothetical protein